MLHSIIYRRRLVCGLQLLLFLVLSSPFESFQLSFSSSSLNKALHSSSYVFSNQISNDLPKQKGIWSSRLTNGRWLSQRPSSSSLTATSKADLAAVDDDQAFKEDFKRCLLWVMASAAFAGGLAVVKGTNAAVSCDRCVAL